jgi:hypothetical protein
MKKWANKENRAFSKDEVHVAKKHEEFLNIPGCKGNANQNYIKILPQSEGLLSRIHTRTNVGEKEKGTLIQCW